jgi:hypothetical protein
MLYPKRKIIMSALLALAFSPAGYAGLVKQEIASDAIATEAQAAESTPPEMPMTTDDEEIVLVKKRPVSQPVSMGGRKVIVREVYEDSAPVTTEAAAPVRKGVGGKIDGAIDKKVEDVRTKMEESLIKAVEGIKINIGDEQSKAPAPVAPAPVAAAPAAVVVQDSVINTSAAPAVKADKVYEDLDETENVSKAESPASDELTGSLSVFPIVGLSMMSSDRYNLDSRYTAGFGLEVDVGSGLAFVGSYTYAQYDVRLANNNPYYNYQLGVNPLAVNSLNTLEYNQNVISTGMRYYFLPKTSRYRFFVGAGTGFQKGYLNYKQSTFDTFSGNQYYISNGTADDYEVTSFLGHLEVGGEVQVSKSIAVGAMTRYNTVLTSRENAPLNNNAFLGNAYGQSGSYEKNLVGGSIRDSGFLSILANLKVSF